MTRVFISIFLLFVIGFAFPAMSLAQETDSSGVGEQKAEEIGKGIIQSMQQTFQEQALPIWTGMWNWTHATLWEGMFLPIINNLWSRAVGVFSEEVEKRTSTLDEELKREKQELTDELKEGTSKATESLWDRLQRIWDKEN